jgi:hypothetical protein
VRLEELRQYSEDHGDCLVPRKYPSNPALADWVSTQRHQYKLYQDGKHSNMTATRIQQLEALGFEWGPRKAKRTAEMGARRQQDEKRTKKSRP